MAYRNNSSYLKFPKCLTSKGNLYRSYSLMDYVISREKLEPHLQDKPSVTESQNVYLNLD